MSSANSEILIEFCVESKNIIAHATEVLYVVEGDARQTEKLAEFGQMVDRIMGGARSLSMTIGGRPALERIGDFAEICKIVGYKASQLKGQDAFQGLCVAFLLDASEALMQMVEDEESFDLDESEFSKKPQMKLRETFKDRLHWISEKFGREYRSTVGTQSDETSERMSQDEIDNLIKKLGV